MMLRPFSLTGITLEMQKLNCIIYMKYAKQIKESLVDSIQKYTDPFQLVIPWLNALFQRYVGNYFNEQIDKSQLTTMGLKNLTFKVQSFNQMNLPFYFESGSVGLLKLHSQLTCIVDNVVINVRLKTAKEWELSTNNKTQVTTEKVQKFKEELMKKMGTKNEKSGNAEAWNMIRNFMQKMTIKVTNVIMHIQCEDTFTIQVNQINLRVRKLQHEIDQMLSTVLIGGISLFLNDSGKRDFKGESCIFSMQQQQNKEKYDQYVIVHLKAYLQERLKVSSTVNAKYALFSIDFKQFRKTLQLGRRILDNLNLRHKKDGDHYKSIDQNAPAKISKTFTCNIIQDYFNRPLIAEQIQTETEEQSPQNMREDTFLEKSEYDEEERLQFESLDSDDEATQSRTDELQTTINYLLDMNETLKASQFSTSVFKEYVNDDDDKQGLLDLDDQRLIFRLRIDRIRIRLANQVVTNKWEEGAHQQSYYEINISHFNTIFTKEMNLAKTTFKTIAVNLQSAQVWDVQYHKVATEQTANCETSSQDLFLSCYEDTIQQSATQNIASNEARKKFFNEIGKDYHTKRLILQFYYGSRNQPAEMVRFMKPEKTFYFNTVLNPEMRLSLPAISVTMGNENLQIEVDKLDFQIDYTNIADFVSLFKLDKIYPATEESIPQGKPGSTTTTIKIKSTFGALIHESTDLLDSYFDQNAKLNLITVLIESAWLSYQTQLQVQFQNLSVNERKQLAVDQQTTTPICRIECIKNQYITITQDFKFCQSILQHLPKVDAQLTKLNYFYNANHLELASQIKANLDRIMVKSSQAPQSPVTIKIEVKDAFIYTPDDVKIMVQINRLACLLTTYASDCQKFITIRSFCIVDKARYQKLQKFEVPAYGNPIEGIYITQDQELCFGDLKYPAREVLFYKQERFDQEGEPEIFLNDQNIVTCNQDKNGNWKIELKYFILQLCEQLLSLEQRIQTLIPKEASQQTFIKPKTKEKQMGKISFIVTNGWLNYLPTYKKSTLMRQFLLKRQPIESLKEYHKEQVYYSWVRALILIKKAEVTLDLSQKPKDHTKDTQKLVPFHIQMRLDVSLYLKSTSRSNISYLNPILLVPPKKLYSSIRKFTNGFQVEKNKQEYLSLLCFKKIASIKSSTISTVSQNMFNLGLIKCHVRLDTIEALVDLTMMTKEKFQLYQQFIEQKMEQEDQSVYQEIEFLQDNALCLAKQNSQDTMWLQNAIELQLSGLEVSIHHGADFPPEIFEESNCSELDTEYYCNHNSDYNFEEIPQESDNQGDCLKLEVKDARLRYSQSFEVKVGTIQVLDMIKKSKFSKLLGTENPKDEFSSRFLKTPDEISLDMRIPPIRICLSGYTLTYLLDLQDYAQQTTPKTEYFKYLSALELQQAQDAVDDSFVLLEKKDISDLCFKEGFQVSFEKQGKTDIKIKDLSIGQIQVTFTFDGNGIRTDRPYHRLIKMAQYENIVMNLKSAIIKDKSYKSEKHLYQSLEKGYIDEIKKDALFISQVFTQFRMINNLSVIAQGIHKMIISMIKQGVWAGVCTGSIPLAKAIGDEIYLLAKKQIEVCEGVTEGIGLRPIAQTIFSPIGNVIDKLGTKINNNQFTPPDFLKRQ